MCVGVWGRRLVISQDPNSCVILHYMVQGLIQHDQSIFWSKESSRSSAASGFHSTSAPNAEFSASGEQKCAKCGLNVTAWAPTSKSVPRMPRKQDSKCLLQGT